jgi:CRISPR-associated protein Cmr1
VTDDDIATLFDGPGTGLRAGWARLDFTVELITPAIVGVLDIDNRDAGLPLRAKSIRGQLRGWWRVLVDSGDLDNLLLGRHGCPPSTQSDAQRRALDFQVWGAICRTDRGHTAAPAPGLVHVGWHQPGTSGAAEGMPGRGLSHALHFAGSMRPDLRHVAAGLEGRLRVDLEDARLAEAIRRVVAAWATFGGIGMRTRRGFGAVKVAYAGRTLDLTDPAGRNADPALVDVGALRWVWRPVPGAGGALQALEAGLSSLLEFRQGVPLARSGARGRSSWPEADVVRQATGFHAPLHGPRPGLARALPRMAFGQMPMRFARSQGPVDAAGLDPAPRTLMPVGVQRLPSSLIVRPLPPLSSVPGRGRGEYRCLMAQFRSMAGAHVPRAAVGGHVATGSPADWPAWDSSWQVGAGAAVCGGIVALGDASCAGGPGRPFADPRDAAQALMNRFWTL